MKSPRTWSTLVHAASRARRATTDSIGVFLRDVGHGLLEVSHNTLALLGLVVVAALAFTASHSTALLSAETQVLTWLQSRQESRIEPFEEALVESAEPGAIARATAADPKDLTSQQAAVAQWISRRYRVAPEPVSRLVQEAWVVGKQAGLDPTLILAIMAIESSFNPFAQSPVGAQGLMQVMTKVHDDKYERFGGNHAAFDPVTNLRVGVQVLKECIARAGSLEGGLKYYVGAANLPDDGGYASKVLGEQHHLREIVRGKAVSPTAVAATVVIPPTVPSGNAPAAKPAASAQADEQIALLR
ncbi:MAG: lytic transglycosylase [Methylibium sp. NZG]|nr:MAG: lytic transglycosylase [Methylibium sp. NZG]